MLGFTSGAAEIQFWRWKIDFDMFVCSRVQLVSKLKFMFNSLLCKTIQT